MLLQIYRLPITTSSHLVLHYYLSVGVRSDFSPATGREKSFGKAVFLLVSCRLLFRDAACFVVSPCSLLFSPRNFSYITAYSPSLTASSPLSHCRSLLHHHPSSPFPISRCLPFVQKKLKWGCSQRWISTLSPDLSHPTLLLTSQPCTLQVMHLYCASSIPLWCCFNNIPGCKFVAFVPCSMQVLSHFHYGYW